MSAVVLACVDSAPRPTMHGISQPCMTQITLASACGHGWLVRVEFACTRTRNWAHVKLQFFNSFGPHYLHFSQEWHNAVGLVSVGVTQPRPQQSPAGARRPAAG